MTLLIVIERNLIKIDFLFYGYEFSHCIFF